MIRFLFFLVLVFGCSAINGQVGINNPFPDSAAVLDINATNKGLLIPRLTTVQREAMSSGAGFSQGMMVYDTDLDILFVGYGNGSNGNKKWYAMNSWKTEYRTNSNTDTAHMTTMTAPSLKHGRIGIGTNNPTKKLEVVGKVKADEFIGKGVAVLGTIVMWSGKVAPIGWVLCDGTTSNGYKTPDLRGRFVVGYDPGDSEYINPGSLSTAGTTVGKSGGMDSVKLTISQIPSHTHTATSSSSGNHRHKFWGYKKQIHNINDNDNTVSCPDIAQWKTNRSTASVGDHSHTIGVGFAGGGGHHENRPPYYTLAYIMRVY